MPSKIFIPIANTGSALFNEKEDILFDLIKNSSYQQRVSMHKHPLLWLAAKIKANDMSQNNYFSHISPLGISPNQIVRSVGYILPDYYPDLGNNVESLAIGGENLEDTVKAWLESKTGHRLHVFGEIDFYRKQECIGIGQSVAKDGRNISVFLSAPCMGETVES